jgi:hypothetical protein
MVFATVKTVGTAIIDFHETMSATNNRRTIDLKIRVMRSNLIYIFSAEIPQRF